MLEVEVFGAPASEAPSLDETRGLCARAAASAGVEDGHLAIEYVDASRSAQLNAEHRGKPTPTDVLSFPIDGALLSGRHGAAGGSAGEREPYELGDVVICPEYTADLREAIVHGVLHLLGMDHETDHGEMLALQDELLDREP